MDSRNVSVKKIEKLSGLYYRIEKYAEILMRVFIRGFVVREALRLAVRNHGLD